MDDHLSIQEYYQAKLNAVPDIYPRTKGHIVNCTCKTCNPSFLGIDRSTANKHFANGYWNITVQNQTASVYCEQCKSPVVEIKVTALQNTCEHIVNAWCHGKTKHFVISDDLFRISSSFVWKQDEASFRRKQDNRAVPTDRDDSFLQALIDYHR